MKVQSSPSLQLFVAFTYTDQSGYHGLNTFVSVLNYHFHPFILMETLQLTSLCGTHSVLAQLFLTVWMIKASMV